MAQTWLSDENGNRALVEYFGSREAAQAALDSLKNCRDCVNCSGCSDCSRCSRCVEIWEVDIDGERIETTAPAEAAQ